MKLQPRTRAMLAAENTTLRRKLRELSAKLHVHEHGFAPLRWECVRGGIYRSKGGDIYLGSKRWLLVMIDGTQSTHRTLASAQEHAAGEWRTLGQMRRAS